MCDFGPICICRGVYVLHRSGKAASTPAERASETDPPFLLPSPLSCQSAPRSVCVCVCVFSVSGLFRCCWLCCRDVCPDSGFAEVVCNSSVSALLPILTSAVSH